MDSQVFIYLFIGLHAYMSTSDHDSWEIALQFINQPCSCLVLIKLDIAGWHQLKNSSISYLLYFIHRKKNVINK